MKKSKPLTGAQKRKQKRELQEREELKEQNELVADIERLKLGPTPLWKFIVDHPDIFEAHVLLSGNLNGTDIKMFYECCRASRRAVIRAKIELQETFWVPELSSISTLELAWEGYPWGARMRLPNGEARMLNQEFFSWRVAETNDLKLLRWVREEKECAWDYRTSGAAAINGNLDILKYCVENGCEVDERHVIAQVPPKTVTSIVSNTYARRTVLGTSEHVNALTKTTTSTYSRTQFETNFQVSKRMNTSYLNK